MAIVRLKISEEEFMRLRDNGRKYELVNGEAKEVPAGVKHDIIGATVISLLRPYAKGRGFIASSQAGFRMKSKNIRCPDVSFTLKERFPNGEPPEGFGDEAPTCVSRLSLPQKIRKTCIARSRSISTLARSRSGTSFPNSRA